MVQTLCSPVAVMNALELEHVMMVHGVESYLTAMVILHLLCTVTIFTK